MKNLIKFLANEKAESFSYLNQSHVKQLSKKEMYWIKGGDGLHDPIPN